MLHSSDVGVSDLGTDSSNLVGSICIEMVKGGNHGHFKEDGLYFNAERV